jgi:iron complex outermembrane receptor protein
LRTPFNPETVQNYELGLKTSALDRKLSLNADVFIEDYANLQRTAFDSNPSVNAYRTTNAGKARVRGIEADGAYLPAKWLKLSGDYAYTDAKYREYFALQDDGSFANYSGNTLPEVPKHQVHVSGELTIPWAAMGADVIAGADYTYRSSIQFVDANDTPQSIIDKTRYDGIIDLRAEWRPQSGKWLVNLFAKNVTDKRALVNFPDFTPYYTTLAEFSDPHNHVYLSRYSPARSFGISVTVTP